MKQKPDILEPYYKVIADSSVSGLLVTNEKDVIIYANKAMSLIAGVPVSKIVGVNILKGFPKETIQYFKTYYLRAKKGLKSVNFEELPIVTPGKKKTHQSGYLVAVKKGGRYRGVVCVIEDVTKARNISLQLRESEKKFRLSFENATDAIVWANSSGIIIECNNATERLIEASREEIVGVHLSYLHPPTDRNFYINAFKKFLKKPMGSVEGEVLTKTGKIRHVIISASGTEILGKTVVQGVFHDITEFKKFEIALKHSEERYRLLFDSTDEGVFVFKGEGSDRGLIISANKAAARQHGYTVDELLKMKVMDLDVQENVRRAPSRFEEILRGNWVSGEVTHITKEGVGFPVEFHAGPLFIGNEKLVLAFTRDISDRKGAEEALKREKEGLEKLNDKLRKTMNDLQERDQRIFDVNEEIEKVNSEIEKQKDRLNTIISEMGEGIMVISKHNDIELMNSRALSLLGYKSIEEMPLGYKKFFVLHLWKELNEGNKDIATKEISLERPRNLTLSVSLARLKEQGEAAGFVAVMRDITLEKQMDRMKSDFVANVSHEIRAPMAPMKESLAIVLDGTAGPINPKQEKFLNILKSNIDRLLRLINDLLDLSKMESGKADLHLAENDVGDMLKEAVDSLSLFAESKHISLVFNEPKEKIVANFDRDKIMQVVINLVNNAIKFTPEGGRVVVSVRKTSCDMRHATCDKKESSELMTHDSQRMTDRNFCEISVSDTGPGMTKEEQGMIFDKYKQFATAGKIKGTGLGLSISKGIVELHGGKIWVESEKGRGSTFRFSI